MKKILIFIFSALLCSGTTVAEISNYSAADDKYSHWSIMLSGGFNMLITERMADWQEYQWEGRNLSRKNLSSNYVDNFVPSGLFQADYMFTPQFGLRFQYLYAPINKKAIYVGGMYKDANNKERFFSDKNGQSHQFTLQLEMNMLNLFYRCRQNTQWGWYIGAGFGAMLYNVPKLTDNSNTPQFDKRYRPIVTIPVNTSVEYSPISSLSVVLHAEVDWYSDDELNGWDAEDQVNDMGLYVGVGLRYNILATKNPHVRLNDMCSYEPLTVGRAKKSTKFKTTDDDDDDKKLRQTDKEDLEELQEKMDELEKRNRELQDKIELMNREIMERLDKYFTDDDKDKVNKYESDEDNSRNKRKEKKTNESKEKNTSKNKNVTNSGSTTKNKPADNEGYGREEGMRSVVSESSNSKSSEGNKSSNINSKTPPTESELKQQQIFNEAMLSNGTEANEVIFDLDNSRVKSKFEVKIGAVAKRMLSNKNLRLDIYAYLKKENLTKANVKLATQRLEAIYYILINRYQIDPYRVSYDIQEPAEDDESADIRCDMVYR